jgi:hypothetical protein
LFSIATAIVFELTIKKFKLFLLAAQPTALRRKTVKEANFIATYL